MRLEEERATIRLEMTEKPIALRPIRDDDRDFLNALYASTREDEMKLLEWSEEEKRRFLAMQFDAQHKFYMEHFGQAQFDLIVRGGEPIGRLYVDRREDEIRLIDIALLPEFRGRGIGGRLLKNLLDEGAEAGKPVRIHVERFNPALRLYRRLGFKQIGDTGVYFLMEWSPD